MSRRNVKQERRKKNTKGNKTYPEMKQQQTRERNKRRGSGMNRLNYNPFFFSSVCCASKLYKHYCYGMLNPPLQTSSTLTIIATPPAPFQTLTSPPKPLNSTPTLFFSRPHSLHKNPNIQTTTRATCTQQTKDTGHLILHTQQTPPHTHAKQKSPSINALQH